MLLSVFFNIYAFVVYAGDISVELYNPQIPWFRSSEYIIQNNSIEDTNCPEWKNLYEDIETTEKPILSEKKGGCIKKIILDPLKSGKYLIPPATVKEKERGEWKTSAFILEVRDPTEEEKKEIQNLAGIIEPEVGFSYKKLLYGSIILTLILAGVAGLAYFFKKYFGKEKTITEKVELPWDRAFRRLNELKTKDLPSQGLYEPYYVQLTWILRYYIEDRFNIHAPEQTTQEFVETTMKEKVLTTEQQRLLYSFLGHCDKVKFAQFVPTIEQMEAGFNLVWNFVQETQVRESQQEDRKELAQKDGSSQ